MLFGFLAKPAFYMANPSVFELFQRLHRTRAILIVYEKLTPACYSGPYLNAIILEVGVYWCRVLHDGFLLKAIVFTVCEHEYMNVHPRNYRV